MSITSTQMARVRYEKTVFVGVLSGTVLVLDEEKTEETIGSEENTTQAKLGTSSVSV